MTTAGGALLALRPPFLCLRRGVKLRDEDYIANWEDELLNRGAVFELVNRHRSEYEEMKVNREQERISDLELRISRLQDELAHLRGQNPHGANVPALTETVNLVAAENQQLADENYRLRAKLKSARDTIAALRHAADELEDDDD